MHPLDGLRGIAALSVAAIFHYRHFYHFGDQADPFWFRNPIFKELVLHGGYAVDLFFLISGFIFTNIYFERIANGLVDGHDFFIRRFARLYPLHIVATIAVGLTVWASMIAFGEPPIPYVGASDAYHLLLNILMLQHVGLQTDHSFNFVSWSLSIEAICYCIFFFLAKTDHYFELCCFLLVIFGVYLLGNRYATLLLNVNVGRGLVGFFSGCLIARGLSNGLKLPLKIAAIALLAVFVLQSFLPAMPNGIGARWGEAADAFNVQTVLLPAILILSVAAGPLAWLLGTALFRKLGELSYGIYMVHVLVQCLLMIAVKAYGVAVPYDKLWFYGVYFVAVLALAEASYRYIERPGQRWILKKYLVKPKGFDAAVCVAWTNQPGNLAVAVGARPIPKNT